MSVLNRIAHFQNRRDEVPNQELARVLVEKKDKKGVQEIAANLWNEHEGVRSDCLKVLYEVGFLDPPLVAPYLDDFIKLLTARNNRLVWGSMYALSTIAEIKADEIFVRVVEIQKAMAIGSVITIDNGVKTLAIVAAQKDEHRKKLFPYLLKHLEGCRSKEIPQHSEKIAVAVDARNKDAFVKVLQKRMSEMTSSQQARVKRVIKRAGKA
jgi:hypothetical protein